MRYEEFVRRVEAIGGFAERGAAERAVRAVVAALRTGLPDEDARALAGELPEPIAAVLCEQSYRHVLDLAEIRQSVESSEAVRPGRAIEHVQIVCRVLGEALSDAARERLRFHLPSALAPELDERDESEPPVRPSRMRAADQLGEGHTLSTGRPGSHRPISESAPLGAQAHSVVRSSNPHGATKLSSARGLTQERAGETLATGKPGAKHKLAGDD